MVNFFLLHTLILSSCLRSSNLEKIKMLIFIVIKVFAQPQLKVFCSLIRVSLT